VGQKIKAHDTMDITLPYLLEEMIIVEDMLGKIPKLRYSDHVVRNATKFPDLAAESYLSNTREIGPLGKPIVDFAH
jgi:hypothetical protein